MYTPPGAAGAESPVITLPSGPMITTPGPCLGCGAGAGVWLPDAPGASVVGASGTPGFVGTCATAAAGRSATVATTTSFTGSPGASRREQQARSSDRGSRPA